MNMLRSSAVSCALLFSASVFAAPPPPAAATSPLPATGATGVATGTGLSWAAASRAQRYDVYFGTSSPLTRVSADQTATMFQPTALTPSTTYFWRVDAKNSSGTTTGATWSFTTVPGATAPGAPANPTPGSGATGV